MVDGFSVFAAAVRRMFNEMSSGKLFVVNAPEFWENYLAAFPNGTDPIYRTRTIHNCSCCRHFIRSVGNVVSIENGAMRTVWDVNGLPEPYQVVADAMSAYIKKQSISDVFLTKFSKYGIESNPELKEGKLTTHHHFYVTIPKSLVSTKVDEIKGDVRTAQAVLTRGLKELTPEAVATVVDLIESGSLYRGEEHKRQILAFQEMQAKFLSADATAQGHITWSMADHPVAKFRNTVIGTLVQDLSEGKGIEVAVRSFEQKVAPANYKRPTALITKAMVDSAVATIQEMGLEPSLQRRHAKLSDVSVNSVLFVDNAVRGLMKDGLTYGLMQEVKPERFDPSRAEEVSCEVFMRDVLPKTTGLELYLSNNLKGNFVSLTAPVNAGAEPLFKWGNDFAWSYDGNVTDSIKDRVKRAGGKVEGVSMRVSLAWFNTDDLDLYVNEPNGNTIYFGNKSGKLDVDMNVANCVRDPVENVRWVGRLMDGTYAVSVSNFRRRESVDTGFEIEIETDQGISSLRFDKALSDKQAKHACLLEVKDGRVQIQAAPGMIIGSASQCHWGLQTQQVVQVNSVILSPNHWVEPGIGNKHWFFILEDCRNPLPCRGIYNEFLHSNLEKHRKVFEVLGDKTKCPVADEQLSGLGFSSGRNDKVSVIARGPKLNKPYTITF